MSLLKKKPYTPPRVVSRRWMAETMTADQWLDIMSMADGFAFIYDNGPAEVWPVANGDDK